MLFAKELGLIPLGTMAHEYLQACQALGPRLRDTQVSGSNSGPKNIAATWGLRFLTSTA